MDKRKDKEAIVYVITNRHRFIQLEELYSIFNIQKTWKDRLRFHREISKVRSWLEDTRLELVCYPSLGFRVKNKYLNYYLSQDNIE